MKNLKQKSFLIFTACIALIIGCTQVDYNNPFDAPPYGDGSEPGTETGSKPSITLDSDTIVMYPDHSVENQLPGYTVEDAEDDEDSLTITHNAPDVFAEQGTYKVEFVVTDSDGLTGSDTLTVVVEKNEGQDIYPPEISINGSNPYYLTIGEPYEDPGATADDVNAEGDLVDLTDRIEVTGISDIDNTTEEKYTVTYSVEDDAGQSDTATRTVHVVDTSEADDIAPVINLTGEDPIRLGIGDDFTDPGATASDNKDGNLTDSIKVSGDVNTSEEGSYTLTYTVSDEAGNQAQETRTVIVEDETTPTDTGDTISPVIQLAGSSYVQVDLESTWDDPGATATDINGDGDTVDLTDRITVSGDSVDLATLGTYTLTYSVTDDAGNRTRVKRDVHVIDPNSTDTEPPVIILVDAGDGRGDTVVMVAGERYSDPGAMANDSVDGDISGRINVDRSQLETSTAGTYHVVYTVSDNAGNTAEEKRVVIVEGDEDSPVINLEGANPCTVFVDETFVEPGYEAHDVIGGSPGPDLTDEVVVDRGEFDISTPGEYTFTYSVTDASGNSTQEIRTVVVTADDIAPEITIEGDNPYTLLLNEEFSDPGASAVDNKDGEVEVESDGSVDPSTEGEYTITYTAVDEAGNTATAERTVNVVTDAEPPELTLDGPDVVTVFTGEAYVEPGYSASDDMDGDITDQVVVDSGGFDSSVTGEYTFTYSVSDAAGNTDTAERIVNVSAGIILEVSEVGDDYTFTISEPTVFIIEEDQFPTGNATSMESSLNLAFKPGENEQIQLKLTYNEEAYEMDSPGWHWPVVIEDSPNNILDSSKDRYEFTVEPSAEGETVTFSVSEIDWY